MDSLGQQGVLQVIPPAELERQLQSRAQQQAQAQQPSQGQDPVQLAGWVRSRFEIFRNHRNTAAGWSERLLQALRAYNGQYDQTRLQEIRRFGGSEIYVRMSAQKCRAASSLLRDVYLSQDRPWAVRPPADPDVDPKLIEQINQLVMQEAQSVAQAMGQPPPGDKVEERRISLIEEAEEAAQKKSAKQARESEDRIEDILRAGGFYHALAEFIVDLPIFPFAVIKGPVVKVVPTVTWPPNGGPPTIEMKPTLTWNRVSPFDVWFTPGVAAIENAEIIEKIRTTRGELNDLLDLPGYNTEEIRAVLDEYGRGGLYDAWDTTDAERAVLESRENPAWNRSGMITMFEYHGNVQGRVLQEYGLAVPDELRDYSVECWVIGSHVIKCHLNPSPRQRHPYFITSYEKVPGTVVGNSLIDLLADIQEASNATMRSLINNMSIASGPQVVVNDDRLTPDETGADLYPWKRWHTRSDPVGANSQPPIQFFMPTSNAQQLLDVFGKMIDIADDVSAIPKYVGGGSSGGAGRTASGLAMLMGNASKILQSVSANIDRDVIEPALLQLSDLILLTDTTGMLSGQEKISVLGVNVAIQRETQRQRQIEFLQATMNPVDQKIVGVRGRGAVLRAVSRDLGLNGEEVVPDETKLEMMQKHEQQQQAQGPIAQMVEKGVQKGVELGVQRVTSELTSNEIAAQVGVEEGAPAQDGGQPASGGARQSNPGMDAGQQPQGQPTSPQHAAAIGQGTRRGPQVQGGMGPRTNLTGSQPGKGAKPISPGPG